MDDPVNQPKPPRWKRRLKIASGVLAMLVVARLWLGKTYPLAFIPTHAHCMKQLGLALRVYANDNRDSYPAHSGGYGDALLLLRKGTDCAGWSGPLTGPGYNAKVFDEALRTGGHVPESECGRVYVQGLKETSNPAIAIAWDKLANPGDHRHGPSRLYAPLMREVCLVDGSMQMISESKWSEFSKQRIELLVKEGIPRERAEVLYAEKPKPSK
ncbi:MAG: hypothetical protein HY300_17765 [Verrucomicrobia bacterium]|nr:hypothetical protein [Verrucomicrobiota bacterium]